MQTRLLHSEFDHSYSRHTKEKLRVKYSELLCAPFPEEKVCPHNLKNWYEKSLLKREPNHKLRTLPFLTENLNRPLMHQHQLLDDGESDAEFTVWIIRPGQVRFVKSAPDRSDFFGVHADSCVFDFDDGFSPGRRAA